MHSQCTAIFRLVISLLDKRLGNSWSAAIQMTIKSSQSCEYRVGKIKGLYEQHTEHHPPIIDSGISVGSENGFCGVHKSFQVMH